MLYVLRSKWKFMVAQWTTAYVRDWNKTVSDSDDDNAALYNWSLQCIPRFNDE